MDQAQQRLLLALGASALLHAWFMQSGDMATARRVTAVGSLPMSATLHVPQSDLPRADAAARPRTVPQPQDKSDSIFAAAAREAVIAVPVPAPPVAPARNRVATEATTMATATSDPTYYPARSLDVYPRALTALNLGVRVQSGSVRATVFIDEAGTVNDVRAIEANAADVENAARELLLRARFTPAGKDGRPVKAQLLVSLEYAAGGGQD